MELEFDEYKEHLDLIRRKAEYFFQKLKPVHLKTTKDFWVNGTITEVGADYLVMQEFRIGERVFFFLEVDDIELYVPPTEVMK